MQKIFIVILSLIILSCSTNRDNDIVITYKGGSVRWWDIKYQAKEFKRMHPDTKSNVELFKSGIVESVVIPKIMAIEAKKSHKNDPLLKKRINLIVEQSMVDTLIDQIYKTAEFKKIAYKIFFVGVKKIKSSDSNSGSNIDDNNVRQLAEQILSRIKTVQNTNQCNSILNHYKGIPNFLVTRGIKDYFTGEEAPDGIYSAVSKLKKKTYFGAPIKISDGNYLLIYLMNKKKITNKNINRVVKNNKSKSQILSFEKRKALQKYFEKIKKNAKIKKHYKNLNGDGTKVLLKIEPNITISVDDFKYRFSQTFIPENLKTNYEYQPKIPSDISDKKKINFIETSILYESLLYNQAILENLDKTDYFKKTFDKRSNGLFVSVFRYDFGKNNFNPTDAEIYEYYKNHNMSLPYEKLKGKIKYQLFSKNYSDGLKKWKQDKIEDYNVQFILENLKL